MSLTIDIDGIVLTSIAHLNFARLANRVCVSEATKQYAVPHHYLGQKICDSKNLEDIFVQHLKKRITVRLTLVSSILCV